MNGAIIVDGVNVLKCKHFSDENGQFTYCYIYGCDCNGKECYFKQLENKEQECDKLKEILKDHDSEGEAIGLAYDALKSEFDKLKAENEELKKELKLFEDVKESLEQDFKDLRCCNLFLAYPDLRQNCFYDRYEKLRQDIDKIEQYCIDTLELQDVHTIKQDILKYTKQAKGEE